MKSLLWLDLEMTGLDVEREVIIEVAAVITNTHFDKLDSYHAVVRQPQFYLERMDAWNKQHHTESGLLKLIPSGKEIEVVEHELVQLVDKYFQNEKVVIAGNSIYQDRLFIERYLKSLSSRLHYRMLDVTAWKIVMKDIYGIVFTKKETHRALDDIFESIEELRTYLTFVQTVKEEI